jgi:putative two-component system response regulator
MAERIALSHHERWNGRGYPNRLAGEEIPFEARIVGLADFIDALTHNRPYRAAWPLDAVLSEVRHESGKHFDPVIVGALLESRCYEPTITKSSLAVQEVSIGVNGRH